MAWVALVAALIQFLGPLLGDLIKKWIDGKLKEAADAIGPITAFATEELAREALFDKAIQLTTGPVRRALLRRAKEACKAAGVTSEGPKNSIPPELAAATQELSDAAEIHE